MSVNNNVHLIGRLTRDPEIRYTQGENPICIAKLTLAVDRRVKKDEEKKTDYISCTSFSKTAECIRDHVKKGVKIAVEGSIQTGSYEKDGNKVYTTDVIIEDFTFCEKKESQTSQGQVALQAQTAQGQPPQGYYPQGQAAPQGYPSQGQPAYQQPVQGQPVYQQQPPQGQAAYQQPVPQQGYMPQGQIPVNQLNPNTKGFLN